ncbi:MAG: (Fe-S)-binding protein [Methanoregulaceae archaeon]
MVWEPPGRNCGACGIGNCNNFLFLAKTGKKDLRDCPFYPRRGESGQLLTPPVYSGKDILGLDYDFVVKPFPDEPSARRYIQPLRTDLIERWEIKPGDILRGRPVEPSCPVQHVLRVMSVDPVTGILACHTVGPAVARKSTKVHDIRAYHEIGFEGVADIVRHEPVVGFRMRFLPANCMRQMVHSGVVQMVLRKSFGVHVRVEDLQMHGKREKLKDVTIRPGDSVSIKDPSGSRTTVLIDGIEVKTNEGVVFERSRENGESGHRHHEPGSGGGGHRNTGHRGHRHDDDE